MRVIKLIFLNFIALIVLLGSVELGAYVYARIYPTYQTLFIQPDRELGWKGIPHFKWVNAGTHWYERSFRASISHNQFGLRDKNRSERKPEDAVRIAVLGDSFIEAAQVDDEKTATRLAEVYLNAKSGQKPRFEVLNFGVTNFAVGQYLLMWEKHAHKFSPDHVLAFVSGLQMGRTVVSSHYSAKQTLHIRPTFQLKEGKLERIQAADFDRFRKAQAKVIEETYGSDRTRRTPTRSYLAHLTHLVVTNHRFRRFRKPSAAPASNSKVDIKSSDENTLQVNLAVLRELNTKIRKTGAQLTLVDMSPLTHYGIFPGSEQLATRLETFARQNQIGYLPLFLDIRREKLKGKDLFLEYDGHFNEEGNKVFAKSITRFFSGTPLM